MSSAARWGKALLLFEVDCPADIGNIHTEPNSLEQLLFELLGNARKFTSPGTVRLVVRPAISLTVSRPALSFIVADDGPGFSLDRLPRLMLDYPIPELRALHRNGVGLFMVAGLCKRLGGELTLVTAIGEGVSVTVTLPVSGGAQGAIPVTQ
jgi:signal transduction histidine kinase